ncbi:DUF2807 domain-containing protein [Mucilaginibacter sp. dw_454]|uniref:GIN domain-containing protein n=1 Tax=Mucilaginibacter sp. dw_454 TaxID=2720079 RepID=UPI001BD2B12C|nr:DUF2807 domain-containing protein [Mucilaginibacter sp. dw_454]
MKTTLLTIATLLLMLTAANNSFAANSGNHQEYTELTWINHFYKIEVHGNVQLHLLSGEKNRVEMNSTYYDHNALVQVENGVLRITCYRTERLQVWVTVDDLRALSAYDNVLVQTEGRFSTLEIDVELFNKAKADLNLDCFATNIKLNNQSMANISGTAIESELISNYAATLNAANFTADETVMKRIAPIWETRIAFVDPDPDPLTDMAGTKELRLFSNAANPIKLDIPAGVNTLYITQNLIN